MQTTWPLYRLCIYLPQKTGPQTVSSSSYLTSLLSSMFMTYSPNYLLKATTCTFGIIEASTKGLLLPKLNHTRDPVVKPESVVPQSGPSLVWRLFVFLSPMCLWRLCSHNQYLFWGFVLTQSVCDPLQLSQRSRRRRRTWRRSAAPLSRPSWAPHCGTRPCLMMETPSSWSTWTWKSSCPRTASPPAPRTTTMTSTNHTLQHVSHRSCPRPHPHRRPRWWTSATTPLPPYTRASSPQTACTAARPEQVTQWWHLLYSLCFLFILSHLINVLNLRCSNSGEGRGR